MIFHHQNYHVYSLACLIFFGYMWIQGCPTTITHATITTTNIITTTTTRTHTHTHCTQEPEEVLDQEREEREERQGGEAEEDQEASES